MYKLLLFLYFAGIGGQLGFCFHLPTIVWDPRNPMFACDNPHILVKLHDAVNFLCPNKAINEGGLTDIARTENLYENAFILKPDQEKKFHECNSSVGNLILNCTNPNKLTYNTLTFKSYSPTSPTFQKGKTYYMIGTGYRTVSRLNSRINGSCMKTDPNDGPYKLRLKIRVCTDAEVNIYKNCSICKSSGCYSKGCLNCGNWTESADKEPYRKASNCFSSKTRNCSNDELSIHYSQEKHFPVTCPTTQAWTTKEPTNSKKTTIHTTISTVLQSTTKQKPIISTTSSTPKEHITRKSNTSTKGYRDKAYRVKNDSDKNMDSNYYIISVLFVVTGNGIGIVIGYRISGYRMSKRPQVKPSANGLQNNTDPPLKGEGIPNQGYRFSNYGEGGNSEPVLSINTTLIPEDIQLSRRSSTSLEKNDGVAQPLTPPVV